MRTIQTEHPGVLFLALLIVASLVGCSADPETVAPTAGVASTGPRAALLRSLPQVSDLPSRYLPLGDLAGHGELYAEGGEATSRSDDGDHYHGYDGPPLWAKDLKGARTEGVVYGVEGSAVISAGYLVAQSDLAASKSFHGLTLRELDFPTPRHLTVDLVEGETQDSNRYLLLWHFVPTEQPSRPVIELGQLPSADSLPEDYVVYACDQFPERFCPGMGRHYTRNVRALTRPLDAEGNDHVTYGEAAGKLIFIEYIVTQEDLVAGVSWPAMPLDDHPIPPIDNVHLLHFETGGEFGLYTIHMYFLPEEIYLPWETEPETL